jgi:hypothetical protein
MQRYRIEFVVPTTFYAYVEADSEPAARQAFIDGDVDESGPVDDPSVAPIDEPDARLTLVELVEGDEPEVD